MGEEGRSEKMGLLGCISYIIGNIVGSGIFITPTGILLQVKSVGMSLIIWVAAALVSMLGSFCYVELGTSIRMSGGDFAYMCFMEWYPVAFAFMCIGCTINYPATLAIQAQTFAEYVFRGFSVQMDDTSEFWAKKLLGFALIWVLMFMNFFSLKTFVSRFQIVASLAKIAATGLVIGIGFYYLAIKGETQNLQNPFNNTDLNPGNIVQAMFAGLYSYDGWDILNFGAGELENPRRNMPLAIIIGMTSIGILYVAVNISYFTILSVQDLESSSAVAMTFADKAIPQAEWIMPIFVAVLLIGSLNSTMFSASRYLQAVAKQRQIPSAISGINPISDSPRVALFVHILIAMIVSFAGDLDSLINYVAFSQWSQRAVTMIALMWIRYRRMPVHPEKMRMPIIMPFLFCLVCASLVVVNIVTDIQSAAVGLGILLGGVIIFTIFIWDRALPRYAGYTHTLSTINVETTKVAQIVFDVMPEFASDSGREAAIGLEKVHPEEHEEEKKEAWPENDHESIDYEGSIRL